MSSPVSDREDAGAAFGQLGVPSTADVATTGLAVVRRLLSQLYENLILLLLALALSTILWVVVTNDQNPPIQNTFPGDILVTAVNVPAGVDVIGDLERVRVRISAPQDSWSRLRTGSFNATANLARFGAGLHEVAVDVRTPDPSVKILEVLPSKITIRLETLARRTIPVQVKVKDTLPFGYVYDQPRFAVKETAISGPSSLVSQVDAAVVEISLENKKVTIDQSFSITLLNPQGRPVEGVRVEPPTMNVQIPIEQQITYKTVPVHPVVHNDPARGYWVESINVNPAIVVVVGNRPVVEPISFLQTSPVDVAGAVNTVEQSVGLNLPEGSSLAGPQKVLVRVQISSVEGSKRLLVTPSVNGLRPEQRSVVDPVDVTLVGPIPVLQGIKPTDVRASVDATGLLPGTYTLRVTVAAPERTKVASLDPVQVRVEVRQP
ncbi:MAG: hypothetical protein HY331_03660 [Chloroflexi bacterium]|nr:hypothetical protein [Chloroflexota bacterium]